MTTLDEVKKAYEDLSEDDKKSFHQSIADRVHESVAAQEEDSGDKDSQSAEDREHEALGAEHADGEGDVDELHETDPEEDDSPKGGEDEDGKPEEDPEKPEAKEEEKGEDPSDLEHRISRIEELLEKLVDSQEKGAREPNEASDDEKSKLARLEQLYNG